MRWIGLLLLVGLLLPATAHADGDVTPGATQFVASFEDVEPASSQPGTTAVGDPVVTTLEVGQCELGGLTTCSEPAICDNGDPMVLTTAFTAGGEVLDFGSNCPTGYEQVVTEEEVTPGLVAAAFQRIPLPESELVVQPPGGRTLVNLETSSLYTRS